LAGAVEAADSGAVEAVGSLVFPAVLMALNIFEMACLGALSRREYRMAVLHEFDSHSSAEEEAVGAAGLE
jgi:hypothetical protein